MSLRIRRLASRTLICSAPIALLAANLSCRYPATETVVLVDTDAPTTRSLTIRVAVEAGSGSAMPAAQWHEWRRGSGAEEIRLPASFAIVPAENGARDATVTVHIQGIIAADATSPEVRLERVLRFALQPRSANLARVFLPMRCADPATGCIAAAGPACTVTARCEEQGFTCGDHGDCVRPEEVTLVPFSPDATVPLDATVATDAPDAIDAIDVADVPDAGPPPRPNVAFITSTAYPPNFGGVAFADDECRMRAASANLPGNFVALLRTTMHAPLDPLAGSRGWVDVTGLPIVDEANGWFDGRMLHPLRRQEDGTALPLMTLWLGSYGGANTCLDWSAMTSMEMGGVIETMGMFNEFTVSQCLGSYPLVCTEIGNVATVRPKTATGRFAFVSTRWAPGGGLPSADAHCAADAMAAHLPGTYRALLTTTTQDAFARFSSTGATWVRVDGLEIVPTAADFVGPSPRPDFETFLALNADGSYAGLVTPWIGTSTTNCSDWMATTDAQTGGFGSATSAWRARFVHIYDAGCSQMRPLICLQE